PRLKWPAHLTPRTFYADDQLEMRRNELRRYVARAAVPVSPVRFYDGEVVQGADIAAGFHTPGCDDSDWRPIQPGERVFREADQLVWLRANVAVTAELAGKSLALRCGEAIARGGANNLAESLLYLNGEPYHGLDGHHRLVFLPEA